LCDDADGAVEGAVVTPAAAVSRGVSEWFSRASLPPHAPIATAPVLRDNPEATLERVGVTPVIATTDTAAVWSASECMMDVLRVEME